MYSYYFGESTYYFRKKSLFLPVITHSNILTTMKLALIGYGKMGHMIEDIARQRGHEIVCIIDVNNTDDFESPAFRSADVAIEFTSPSAAYGNYLRAWKQGVKVVSGSTGWLKEHEADVRRACSEEGHTLFWASNFSLGVAIFSAVNKYLARIMNAYPSYDVSEVETHHVHKLDAPSGTAITLAEQVCAELDRKDTWVKGEVHNANGTITGTKNTPENLLRIDAIREGEVPGIHTLTYDSPADMIQITHSAHNRSGFALGAVLAAEFTATHEGLLSTDDLFQF